MDLKARVRERYGAIAARVRSGARGRPDLAQALATREVDRLERRSCCGGEQAARAAGPITADLYDHRETDGLPAEAVAASLGCGNPTALASLHPGEVVLDLGSGGGIDVLLSARRVGPSGRVYGLDMSDEMLALARENQQRAGATHVEFLKGDLEDVPLPAESVDVVISNCVINLTADKDRALREAFRVLRPGGRLAVSDVVRRREVPAAMLRSVELWMGCVAGALHVDEYRAKLAAAGFTAIDIEATRVYDAEDVRPYVEQAGLDIADLDSVDGAYMSAFVRAVKPVGRQNREPGNRAPEPGTGNPEPGT